MKYNLSEINEVIRNRRTIYPKHFSSRKVHREQVEAMLENARWAPTHKMTQPWHFKVFMGEGLQKLAAFYEERAKGGVGLIVTGGFSPNLRGRLHPLSAEFSKPKHAEAHKVVTEAVHKHGSKIALQILHACQSICVDKVKKRLCLCR